MTLFSARFIVLACLCAALPLTPPVEAAHLQVSRSTEGHTTFPHDSHQTPKHSSSGGSTPAHKHSDEHKGHGYPEPKKEPRFLRPPPLLRYYRAHDHKNTHDQSHDAHGRGDDKTSPSAFARSRYRRERSRSSVYVHGEHGNTYIVSGTPSNHGDNGHASGNKQRRQVDGNNLASGRIDVMSAAQSSGGIQRLASLTVDSTPIDWTSGRSSVKAFSLNASSTNRTQFIMVPTDDSDVTGKRVKLATQVFDADGADLVMYCATYNAKPGTPSALLMTPCDDAAQFASSTDTIGPCTGNGDDVSSSNSQQSQIFSYDPFSGAIQPILSTGGSSSSNSSSNISASCAGAKVRRDTTNSTTSGSATPSSTSTSTASPNPPQYAQNVTLVYVAGALEVPAPSLSIGISTMVAKPSVHMNQAAMVTTTITTTVVTTVTASKTVSPAMADASVATSSLPTSTSRSSLSSSGTATSGTAKTTPANAEESLEVELVGVAPSTTTTSSSTSPAITSSTSTTSSSSSSSSPSPSLDAEAVASLVVEQMHHRSVAAVASASVV